MDWLIENKEWIFGGIGCTVIAGIVGVFFAKHSQNQKVGNNSFGVQAGRDANVSKNRDDRKRPNTKNGK